MKVYAKIDSLYGEETRVVIETTRESWNLTLEEAKALYNQLEASIESIERFTS